MARQKGPAGEPVVPETFPAVLPPNYPSASHDFTLQAVMEMQKTVGQLCEAVSSLKEQSREHDRKLDSIVKDHNQKLDGIAAEVRAVGGQIRDARVVGKTLLWVVGVVWTVCAIVLAAYLRAEFSKRPALDPSSKTGTTAPVK